MSYRYETIYDLLGIYRFIPASLRLDYEQWKVGDYFCISQFYTLLGRLLVDSLTALVVQAGVVGASVGSLLTLGVTYQISGI